MYRFFNTILRGKNKLLLQKIIYFLSGFLKSLNIIENHQLKNNCILYHGINLKDFSELNFFKKNIDKFICIKSIISSFPDKYQQFTNVLFVINYKYNGNCLSNCFDISDIFPYPSAKEYLFKPFSFFKIIDVKINEQERKAEICLNYIGKSKDFETNLDLLNQGKNIQYSINRNCLEII